MQDYSSLGLRALRRTQVLFNTGFVREIILNNKGSSDLVDIPDWYLTELGASVVRSINKNLVVFEHDLLVAYINILDNNTELGENQAVVTTTLNVISNLDKINDTIQYLLESKIGLKEVSDFFAIRSISDDLCILQVTSLR